MKKSFFFILVLTIINTTGLLAAGGHFDAKSWHNVRAYDVRTLSKDFRSHVGELVAVKFNFRGKDIHHIKPNWHEGSIWQPDPNGKKGFSDVRVMVAKKDLPAFKSITADSTCTAEVTAYGRVRWDSENNFVFIELIGRNAAVDASGNANVSW